MSVPAREHQDAVALLAAEAGRARGGAGRLVLLRGATGTGRTTVLERAMADAAGHGMRVLNVHCCGTDHPGPLSTVLQLLCSAPEFVDLAVDPEEPDSAETLWRLLRGYAVSTPLLLAVDDVHLADPASRHWLALAARRIERLPVLLVVTERSQYDVDLPSPGITHALPPALIRTHTLPPLTRNSGVEMVSSARPDASPGWVGDCVRAGAASPLLLRALLEDLGGDAAETVPEVCAALYPGAYPAAVRWWLDNAGPLTREVARALAVLDERGRDLTGVHAGVGEHLDPAGLLAGVTGADPARVLGWVTAMTRLGLLRPDATGRLRYAHPLLRDAVLMAVPEQRRQAVHRAAAETLSRRGATSEAVARQLLQADAVGTPWALGALAGAAALTQRDGRLDAARAFLRRTLAEPISPGHRQRLLVDLGSLEYAGGRAATALPRLADALRLAEELLPSDAGAARAGVRAAVALGTALAGLERTVTSVELLTDVSGHVEDRPELADVLLSAAAVLGDRDDSVRPRAHAWLRALEERQPGRVGAAGRALLVRHAALTGRVSAQEAMERLRTLLAEPSDASAEPFLVGTAAAVAVWADQLDEAERLLESGLSAQSPASLHPMLDVLAEVRADLVAARGDLTAVLATDEVRSGGARDAGALAGDAHAIVALVEAGRVEEAARRAWAVSAGSTRDAWGQFRFRYAKGVLRMAEGDPAGALHDFLECGRRLPVRETVCPVVAPWRIAAIEAHLALGNRPEALALAEEEVRLARIWDTPRTTGRALNALAAVTGGRRGLTLADQAVALLRAAPAETELVAALITRGRLLVATGDAGAARHCLRDAAELAERLGAVRLRRQAEQALRDSGARRPVTARTGVPALTASERHVAGLAADGRTNGEIAAMLHVARRTVETHLTSTYRKLGIQKRVELRRVLEGQRGV
ncbi:AAA family ATPase [Streptomyces sp. NPDC087425]|uniref:AAA family ATPase n=1 Tax=Streptomyces sp. NPDC087425 TaxID=3365787 RepID=UPI00380E053F